MKKNSINKTFLQTQQDSQANKIGCVVCGANGEIRLFENKIVLCKSCGVQVYKKLAQEFVPRAIENVVLRSEKQGKNSKKIVGIEI